MSRDHRKLRAFEHADRFTITVYRATARGFPKEEVYGLRSQLRRATASVPTNIVEGCARRSQSEYIHFLNIAFASLREAGYLADLSSRLGFIEPQAAEHVAEQYDQAARILSRLLDSFNHRSP